MRNIDRYKADLALLKRQGQIVLSVMVWDVRGEASLRTTLSYLSDSEYGKFVEELPLFRTEYEKWYSTGCVLLRQVLPHRLNDFVKHYEKPKGRKEITYENYVLDDYMHGLKVTRGGEIIVDVKAALPRLQSQIAIIDAAEARFESSIFDLRQLIQADLFDSEMDSASHLLSRGFLRAAGAVSGVVLEKHLHEVCVSHQITVAKKNPSISDLNDLLKANSVIEIPQWRFISLLGDIRNLCDHNKTKDPTKTEVDELVGGVKRILKTIF